MLATGDPVLNEEQGDTANNAEILVHRPCAVTPTIWLSLITAVSVVVYYIRDYMKLTIMHCVVVVQC
jgi:hypothetical protein